MDEELSWILTLLLLTVSTFHKFCHVRGTEVEGLIKSKKFVLADPECSIVLKYWFQFFLDFWVFLPTRTVVIKLTVVYFTSTPRIPHVDETTASPSDITVGCDNRIGVVCYQSRVLPDGASSTCSGCSCRHYIIRCIPLADAFEQIILGNFS
ncbi:unnamed protein product [Pseudo-nitzschia multistriata]|uniref:Uncharacterized protein n=1 Tax=Pseudo-nitzschia multistriata TaxID=183589 RepID=A0A448ZMS3_9STRA|nr:unnamed protein product [Pseudo-nitzschia multistriata]